MRDARKSAAMRDEGTSQRIVLDEIVAACISHGEKHIRRLRRSVGGNEHPVFARPISRLGRRRILRDPNKSRISRESGSRKQSEPDQEEDVLHGFSPEQSREAARGKGLPRTMLFLRSRTSIGVE